MAMSSHCKKKQEKNQYTWHESIYTRQGTNKSTMIYAILGSSGWRNRKRKTERADDQVDGWG